MELKRHASYWMNWKRWEHLNRRGRDWEDLTSCTLRKCFENRYTGKIKIQKMEKSQLRIMILTYTDFGYLQVLNSKNQNLIRLIISILSRGEETPLWMGYDGFHDNVRKDLNYG